METKAADELAARVVRHGLTVPAVLFLESVKPLNMVGAQTLHFVSPMLGPLMPGWRVDEFAQFLEDRGSIEYLLRRIETLEGQL